MQVVHTAAALRAALAGETRAVEAAVRLKELISATSDAGLKRDAARKMAGMLKLEKNYRSAIEYLRKALTDEKTDLNAQTQYEIAELFEAEGDLNRAAREYLKAPRLYPKSVFWGVRARLSCAKIFERLQKWEEAKHLYEKLASMDVEESKFAKERLERTAIK